MAKETKMLKNEEAKKLGKPATKGLKAAETKKLPVSKTRAKKIKHSYKVKDAENALLLKLKDGDVVIEMYPDAAPNHVARIKELVRAGFYNGLKFHRVIDGFMAQTGCPYGNGTGGTGKKLKAEFNRNPHKRHGFDGSGHEPGFRRQPVFHLLCRLPVAGRPIYGLGRSYFGYGICRPYQTRRRTKRHGL